MSSNWTILAVNALTGAVLDELPLVAPTDFERLLNGAGSFEGCLPLAGRTNDANGVLRLTNWLQAAEPNQIVIFVQNNSAYEWAGLVQTHDYDSTTGILKINGKEFASVLERSFWTIAPNGVAQTWNQDIVTTAATFVQTALTNLGVTSYASVVAPVLSGVVLSITFQPGEQHKILDELTNLAAQQPGFDWAFDPVPDANGNPTIQCTLSAPRRGISYNTSGISLDYPGPITKWKITKDGTQQVPQLVATGAGSGPTQLQVIASANASGYLPLQSVQNNADMDTQPRLNAWATSQVTAHGKTPPIVFQATVLGEAWYGTGLGIGDELTFVLQDPYFGNQTGSIGILPQRVVGLKTTLADGQGNPDLVDLTCGPPL